VASLTKLLALFNKERDDVQIINNIKHVYFCSLEELMILLVLHPCCLLPSCRQ
jgi:hypothetical protein